MEVKKTPGQLLLTIIIWQSISCATILNKKVETIIVSTGQQVHSLSIERAVLLDSSSIPHGAIYRYEVTRGRNQLPVTLQLEHSQKTIYLTPRNSVAFWLNFSTYGLGMLVDLYNPKRFGYSRVYSLSASDTANRRYYFRTPKIKKSIPSISTGALFWSTSMPLGVNIFDMAGSRGTRSSAGIFGIYTGIDYYYKKNHFLSFDLGAATDDLPVDYIGPGYVDYGRAIFTSARENYVWKNLSLGYGISLTKFFFTEIDLTPNGASVSDSRDNLSLGFSFSAQWRLLKFFNLEIRYQPAVWNTSFKPSWIYQDYLSLNAVWRLPLHKLN